ncbi:hypothetical protein C5C66_03445 [Rathayibacter toxicus]|uniref:Cardiolipin synthase N-terminal domain-containing protein n=2 Tax=Rathayibacter toxicus TaxID=145458 RepID=A0A2S5Y979_9MICO|nr:hypothetical protein C5D15_03420 [Rathayibacter toxicus]PPG47880.1 hypothetical protein C5D16_03410 [Rathayibacter toxicus]PPH25024.1 hypothetical protein C5D17_03395 [Rathayibacter toxicus]PPH58950.1 hypothetical protein C5D30_03415 [Rathayibacter toxicus]PPH60944.1 hypothetical protein C5C93_03445 [Rathayibacter toxicus]
MRQCGVSQNIAICLFRRARRSRASRPEHTIPWNRSRMNSQSLLVVMNIVLLLFAIQGVLANARLSTVAKVLWVAFIVVAPFVGSIAYLLVGRRAGRGPGGGASAAPERSSGWFFER